MGRIEPMEKETREPAQRGPNAFQRSLRWHVRHETADGRNIVLFLIGVMDGSLNGFKPHHRLEAARELAAYITSSPSPSTGEGWGEGDSPAAATKPEPQKRAAGPKIVRPESVEGQCSAERAPSTREYADEGDSPAAATKPDTQKRGAGRRSQSPTRSFPPITIEELERFDFTREHAALYNFARDEITGGIYGYDELGPFVADEDGKIDHIDPSRVAGYERATSVVPAEAGTQRSGRVGSQLRTNN